MTRVLALVLVTLVLLFTGFWLARHQGAKPSRGAAQQTTSSSSSKAPVAPGGSGTGAGAGGASAASGANGAGSGGAVEGVASVPLPDGYFALPYLGPGRQLVFDKPRQVLEPNEAYAAVLVTSKGDITVTLLRKDAPKTVDNFVFLALNRFYNGVPFHRVLDGFMAQTGDPTGTGTGGPGYAIPDEISPRLHFDKRGVVAMANAGPNTNGSQFFITFAPTPWLDGHYSIFGQVVAGGDVLAKLQRIDPQHPLAVVGLDDTLGLLASKGVELSGPQSRTVGDALTRALGVAPVSGQSSTVNGYRAVVGTANGRPAVAFFPQPDMLERVVIAVKPAS